MFSNSTTDSKVMTYTNKDGNVSSSVNNYSGRTLDSGIKVQTMFDKQNAYMNMDKNKITSGGTFEKKKWDEDRILKGNLSQNHVNKLFNSKIKLPNTLPIITNNDKNLNKMGYVYHNEIPNEEIITKTINQTDPYYTKFFLSRGGNNK